MDDTKRRSAVDTLLENALNASDAAQACGYSQAACNAANVLRVLVEVDTAHSHFGRPPRPDPSAPFTKG